LNRKWTYNSTELSEEGSSRTIQWSAGQLSDWAPKTIPYHVIQGYGSPSGETSVYKLEGDDLTRINDPNRITCHRMK